MGLPMDEVDVEIAPGADQSADPTTWTWVSLCDPEPDYPNGRIQRPITITRGRASESGSTPPSTFTATVRNEDGALTPNNPMGPWFGSLGRGTPLRVTWSGSGRFFGFISELPTTWLGIVDNSRVEIKADGVLRRLEQGAKPLRSTLYRATVGRSDLIAYWPGEETSGATEASSPVVGVYPFYPSGAEFGTGEDVPAGSEPGLIRVTPGVTNTIGQVPPASFGRWRIYQLFRVDEPDTGFHSALSVHTLGSSVAKWQVEFSNADIRLRAYNIDGGTVLTDTDAVASTVFGQWWIVTITLTQSGSSIDWAWTVRTTDASSTLLASGSGTQSSSTFGRVVAAGLGLGPAGAGIPERWFGHVTVMAANILDPLPVFDFDTIRGYPGETAGRRLERLCAEEGVAFTSEGSLDDTTPMGPQRPDTFLALMRECAAADLGLLYEPSDWPGLAYRTRVDLYNQTATTIDFCDLYGAPQLLNDDNALRNDVTVANPNGTSARLVDQTHIQQHGRYDEQYRVNVATSGHLLHVAGWRLNLGTTDAPRWPLISIAITSETQHILTDWLALSIGDRLIIPHEVPQLPGVDVDLLIAGWTETIYSRRAEVTLNCIPAAPWQVAEYESAEGGDYRYDTAGSSLAAEFDAGTDTSMSVNVDVKPLWTVDDDEFPFDIEVGGVRLTVTDISGASSPQTFTITATPVNGITKTIPAGTAVSLWTKARYAL